MVNPWTDKDVEAHWDRVATIYIEENNRVRKAHAQRFRESILHLEFKNGIKLLNITSRDGEAEAFIREAGLEIDVLHAEISSGLMKEAAKLNPGIRQIKLANYSELPFADQSFERILSLETLEHVSEPLKFLQELHRISRPGARMVLSCPPATSEIPYRIYTKLFGGHGEGPHRFPSSETVKKWLTQTGWNLILHKGTVLIPAGPEFLQNFGEKIIGWFQKTCISELGIRQFYICERA